MIKFAPLVALVVVGGAQANSARTDGPSCAIPAKLPQPTVEVVRPAQVRKIPVGSYKLALSWSPEFCRSRKNQPQHATQCQAATPFGLILHGLWPEGQGREWPQYCAPAPALTVEQTRKHFCMTPSPQLLQHEWAKHGTCMTKDPDRYFQAAQTLYRAAPKLDMDALSREGITIGEFKQRMSARDKTLPTGAINVKVNNGGWLQEVHICLDTRFQPQVCPASSRTGDDRRTLKIWRAQK